MEILPKWMTGDKKKKKKTDWKGAAFPYIQKGESPAQWGKKVEAWKKANPGKEIPDSKMYYLDAPPELKKEKKKKKSPDYMGPPKGLQDPMRIERHHKTGKITEMGAASGGSIKKYAHGGGVRKTNLSDY